MRPLLFHRLLSQHPVLLTPESSSRLLSRLFAASVAFAMRGQARLSLVPLAGLTCRRCKFHFMLRAAVLLPFLMELQRFDIASHPAARLASQARFLLPGGLTLPGLDLHQQADDDFSGHITLWWATRLFTRTYGFQKFQDFFVAFCLSMFKNTDTFRVFCGNVCSFCN